jgi:AcrR family transcriptional regulator
MAERWTRERRRQHTRDVLLEAAEEIFVQRGFEGASLEEIAETAGYTRGAIYKHFGTKEELFFAVNERFNERFLENFVGIGSAEDLDLAAIAKRWYDLQTHDVRMYALGAEFNLYLLRNPDARERVVGQRRARAEMIASFIDEQAARSGLTLKMPSITFARLVLATTDGLEIATFLDGTPGDLYEPFLQLLSSIWEPTD